MAVNKPHNPIYPRFTLEDYKENPSAIKKVNDAALQYLETTQSVIEQKDAEIARMRNRGCKIKCVSWLSVEELRRGKVEEETDDHWTRIDRRIAERLLRSA